MMNGKHKYLLMTGSLTFCLAMVAACGTHNRRSDVVIVPGPIVTAQPGIPIPSGGSGVGTDPVPGAPTPAPVIPPGPTPTAVVPAPPVIPTIPPIAIPTNPPGVIPTNPPGVTPTPGIPPDPGVTPTPGITPPPVITPDPNATPGPSFAINQITFIAENFVLTQSDSTGIVGHGTLFGSQQLSNSFGLAAVDRKFPPESNPIECANAFVGRPPFFVINEENGTGVFLLGQNIAEEARLRNRVTLAGQALTFARQPEDGRLVATIEPSNFDEVYRVNYFQSEQLEVKTATCVTEFSGGENPIGQTVLRFTNETRIIPGILRSTNRLFSLRGTAGGASEPGSGLLLGPQIFSDQVTASELVGLSNPRFSGVQNLLDVSGNQLRTDISIVVDQVRGEATQAAIQDQDQASGVPDNVASGSIPNTNLPDLTGRGPENCPANAGNDFVCGRFQFNQPFRETTIPGGTEDLSDVLVIQGIFVGRTSQ